MPQRTRTILKSYFESGDTPTTEQFQDLIDSFLNKKDDGITVGDNNKIGLGTATPQSKLDILGGLSIGQNYAGQEAAPLNGLLVEGNTGLGITQPVNKLDVSGGLSIGAGYAGVVNAPENGLLVEGKVGIGVQSPSEVLTVKGSIAIEEMGENNDLQFGKIYAKESSLYSLHFDGIDDYVDLSDHVESFKALKTGTISFWYKSSPEDFKHNRWVFWFGNNETQMLGVRVGNIGDAGESIETFIHSDATSTTLQMQVDKGYDYLADGKWHYVAYTYGKEANRVFLDGIDQTVRYTHGDVNNDSKFFNIDPDADGFLMGRMLHHGEYSGELSGSLDEVAIFNRPLTSAEISKIHSQGRNFNLRNQFSSELVAYWRMDRGDVDQLTDHSGNNYHGKIHGPQIAEAKVRALYYKDSQGKETALTNKDSGVEGINTLWEQKAPHIYYDQGNVGIGTSNPGVELDIWKDAGSTVARVYNAGTNAYFGSAIEPVFAVSSQHDKELGEFTPGHSIFTVGRDESRSRYFNIDKTLFTVLGGGNVGIGTTSPKQTMEINGDVRIKDARSLFFQRTGDEYAWRIRNESAADGKAYGYDGTNKLVFEVVGNSGSQSGPGADSHGIYTSSKDTLVLTEKGKVGIGTTSPIAKLHVAGDLRYNMRFADNTNYIELISPPLKAGASQDEVMNLVQIRNNFHWGGIFLLIEVFCDYYDPGYKKYVYKNNGATYSEGGNLELVEDRGGASWINLNDIINTSLSESNGSLWDATIKLMVPTYSNAFVKITGSLYSMSYGDASMAMGATRQVKFLQWNW